jgi:tRNA(Ile)-lysidine synthase
MFRNGPDNPCRLRAIPQVCKSLPSPPQQWVFDLKIKVNPLVYDVSWSAEGVLPALEAGWRRVGAPGRGVLLAVSGGADSTALLVASAELAPALGLRLEVASVDHGLRSEAGEELRKVERLCAERGLRFHALRVGVAAGNLEAGARVARYAALERCREVRGLSLVATAHTLEDQAETVLLRLGRGADLRGLCAIRAVRGAVVRPMLRMSRSGILPWLSARGLVPVRDPMNVDPRFARVRVRTGALPALEAALGREVFAGLARLAERAEEDEAWLEAQAREASLRLRLAAGGLDAVGLAALPPALGRRVLRALLESEELTVDAATLEDAWAAVPLGRRVTLPRGLQLRTASGVVRCVAPGREARSCGPADLSSKLWRVHEPSGWSLRLGEWPGDWTARVPAGALSVRGPKPGDVLGFGPGGRLQDLLVNARVPAEVRPTLAVVEGPDGRVACVVGVAGAAEGPQRLVARARSEGAGVSGAGYTSGVASE